MPNPVVHFEISGEDGAGLRQFYHDAFEWTVEAEDALGFGAVDGQQAGIGGMIGRGAAAVTLYIEVRDLAGTLERIRDLGGIVVQDVTEDPEMAPMALFADPGGNVLGLIEADSTDEAIAPGTANDERSAAHTMSSRFGDASEPFVLSEEDVERA
ncbi:MAG: VOC family protein [Dehalococcoidia bacterium]